MIVKPLHPGTVLTVLFLVLKLTGVIDWSWWLVFLPFYGLLILSAVLFGVSAFLHWAEEWR